MVQKSNKVKYALAIVQPTTFAVVQTSACAMVWAHPWMSICLAWSVYVRHDGWLAYFALAKLVQLARSVHCFSLVCTVALALFAH